MKGDSAKINIKIKKKQGVGIQLFIKIRIKITSWDLVHRWGRRNSEMKTTIPAISENLINITIDKVCIRSYSLCFFKSINLYIYGPPVRSSNRGLESFWGGRASMGRLPSGAGGSINCTFSDIVDI